jgi:3'-5' exoribonuclease
MRLLEQAGGNTAGIEGFCIVKSALVKVNSKGSAYLDMIIADNEGEIDAKLWDYDALRHGVYDPDQVIKVRGSINIWKDAEQFKIDKIRPARDEDGVDMASLIPSAPFDGEWMYRELYDTAETFENDDLRRLTQYLMKNNKELLLRAPAAVKLHHSMRGGLLYHTYSMLRVAKAVCPLYPALNHELLYTGVILHDIAKLSELTIGKLGLAPGYTVAGQLLGHITLGVAAVSSTCELLDIPEETGILVQHMILAHHGVPEFGSPRPPMFPEAAVLATLDLLDARIYEMYDALKTVPQGTFSERIWALDNRQLYQHHLR